MTRHRYRSILGKRYIATCEQVVASEGKGDSKLRKRARDRNTARLQQVVFALLEDLGMPSNNSPTEDPNYWYRAFLRLAKRHVPGMAPLKVPGSSGRPVEPADEEADEEVDATVQARGKRSILAVCEDVARRRLGTDASAADVRKLGAKWRQRYHDRQRRYRQARGET